MDDDDERGQEGVRDYIQTRSRFKPTANHVDE